MARCVVCDKPTKDDRIVCSAECASTRAGAGASEVALRKQFQERRR